MQRWLKRAAGGVLAALLLLLLLAAPHAHLHAPAPTPLLSDTNGTHLAQLGTAQDAPLGYWPVEGELPWRVTAAILAIEDRRFSDHPGVDPFAVARALRDNLRYGRRISGASTIAMQVARMQRPGARTWRRKVQEATTALLLTARYGRDEILRHYLRIVPYGNRVRGIRYAARRYLDKPVADLSWAEIAFLAAIPQSPSHTNPTTAAGAARAKVRAGRILDQLYADGLLSTVEHAWAHEELARIPPPPAAQRPEAAMHAILRLEPRAEALPVLARATLDLDLQRRVQDHLRAGLRHWRSRGAGNGAVMVVSIPDFSVRAAVGSADWSDDAWAGAIDYTDTPRYPGSTIKPFLYALALDRGDITPATVLEDLQRGPEGLDNADHRYLGPLLPRLADRLPVATGQEPVADYLARVEDAFPAMRWANDSLPQDAQVALLYTWTGYLLQRDYVLGSVEDHIPVRHWLLTHGEDSLTELQALGVTHLIVGRIGFLHKTYSFLSKEAFEEAFLDPLELLEERLLVDAVLIYEARGVRVYRLPERKNTSRP